MIKKGLKYRLFAHKSLSLLFDKRFSGSAYLRADNCADRRRHSCKAVHVLSCRVDIFIREIISKENEMTFLPSVHRPMHCVLFCLCMLFCCHKAVGQTINCEDTCAHVHGIDLSHYQGNVFWEAVSQTKMAYVYLKATEGGTNIDDKYKRNIDLAHQYGLKVGSYHFYRPRVPQEVQLANFRMQCRPEDQDLIPMVDIETKSGLGTEEFCDSLSKFIRLVEQEYGCKPLLYTFTNFYNANLSGKYEGYKFMIAQYTERLPVLNDGRDFEMWQYTSKGSIDGVRGNVDKSRFMGTHSLREIRFRHKNRSTSSR